jgi:hypothetical protein
VRNAKWVVLLVLLVLDGIVLRFTFNQPNTFAYAAPILAVVTTIYTLAAAWGRVGGKTHRAILAGAWEPFPNLAKTGENMRFSQPRIILVPLDGASTQAADLASKLTFDRDRIWVPEGASFEGVRLESYGTYGRGGYSGSVKLEKASVIAPASGYIQSTDNQWGGLVDPKGIGLLVADGFRFNDARYRDILLVPIQPSEVRGEYDVKGTWERGSLDSTVSVEGVTMAWSVRPSISSDSQVNLLVIWWKYGKGWTQAMYNVSIASEMGGADVRVLTQPWGPVVLVGHRKQFNPLNIVNALSNAGVLNKLIVGGRGVGGFKATVYPQHQGVHFKHFDSEEISF